MISKWKNNLLNLLKVGGLVVAIALVGASLGVATSTNTKNTEFSTKQSTISDEINNDNSSVMKNPGILGLYGGFNEPFVRSEKSWNIQTILGIKVGKNEKILNEKVITVKTDDKELEILDLSKTIGNLEWIKKQLKYPNVHTSTTNLKTLAYLSYSQVIEFWIQTKKKVVNSSVFGHLIDFFIKVQAMEIINRNIKSYNFKFSLVGKAVNKKKIATVATSMRLIEKSTIFQHVLINTNAIAAKGLDILLWKKDAIAKADASDADLAIILNKKSGKLYIWVKKKMIIISQTVAHIFKPKVVPKKILNN